MLLNIYAVGVVRTHFVQRENVQNHKSDQHDGQRHNVQGEEAIQRRSRDEVVATHPN